MEASLRGYIQKCNNDLQLIGITTGNITGISINTRATSRLGRCRRLGNGNFEIEISKFILTDIKKLTDTIYHELLHTVENCFNHGNTWKAYANKVNNYYNMNISRTSEATEEFRQEKISKAKYMIVCKGCGQIIYRQKKSKLITEMDRYKCGKCGAKLEIMEGV